MTIQHLTFRTMAIGIFVLGLVSACGQTTGDRALSGGAIGAGTGAVIGAVVPGVGIVPAAIVGGVIGAGTGVLTTPSQVDLGKPVWRN